MASGEVHPFTSAAWNSAASRSLSRLPSAVEKNASVETEAWTPAFANVAAAERLRSSKMSSAPSPSTSSSLKIASDSSRVGGESRLRLFELRLMVVQVQACGLRERWQTKS